MKLFAGPTLNNHLAQLATGKGFEICPPVRRFDIPRLLEKGYHGVLVIVDGFFFQDMSVGHAEILFALNRGCEVFGLSSMGAIRAHEMQSFGMKGYGKVFSWFSKFEDFQDDEVALLHGEGPEYLKLSEPLVHFRECLQHLQSTSKISAKQHEVIISALKHQFFGNRTIHLFEQLIDEQTALSGSAVTAEFEPYRIKTHDLEQFIIEEPWVAQTP